MSSRKEERFPAGKSGNRTRHCLPKDLRKCAKATELPTASPSGDL